MINQYVKITKQFQNYFISIKSMELKKKIICSAA